MITLVDLSFKKINLILKIIKIMVFKKEFIDHNNSQHSTYR